MSVGETLGRVEWAVVLGRPTGGVVWRVRQLGSGFIVIFTMMSIRFLMYVPGRGRASGATLE